MTTPFLRGDVPTPCAAQGYISFSALLCKPAQQVPAVRKAPLQEGVCHSANTTNFLSPYANLIDQHNNMWYDTISTYTIMILHFTAVQGGSHMAAKKVGTLIKEARTNAGMTQEQLARKISGLTASDISLAERDKKDLTQEQLKQIAKATGVTQASLINAAKGTSSSSKKTSSSSSTKKTSSSSSGSSMKLTATEKKLVELYRQADSDTKKAVLKQLKGEDTMTDAILESLLNGVQDMISGKR